MRTLSSQASTGKLQWHIPLITFLIDKIFWYFHIGGAVLWRKLRIRWATKNLRGKIDFLKKMRDTSGTAEEGTMSNNPLPTVAEVNVESDGSDGSESKSRRGEQLERQPTFIKRERVPCYWDTMKSTNNGKKPLKETKEKLMRFYMGDNDIVISRDELVAYKKGFYIAFAIGMDQFAAILFPLIFAIFITQLTVKWDLEWGPTSSSPEGKPPFLTYACAHCSD